MVLRVSLCSRPSTNTRESYNRTYPASDPPPCHISWQPFIVTARHLLCIMCCPPQHRAVVCGLVVVSTSMCAWPSEALSAGDGRTNVSRCYDLSSPAAVHDEGCQHTRQHATLESLFTTTSSCGRQSRLNVVFPCIAPISSNLQRHVCNLFSLCRSRTYTPRTNPPLCIPPGRSLRQTTRCVFFIFILRQLVVVCHNLLSRCHPPVSKIQYLGPSKPVTLMLSSVGFPRHLFVYSPHLPPLHSLRRSPRRGFPFGLPCFFVASPSSVGRISRAKQPSKEAKCEAQRHPGRVLRLSHSIAALVMRASNKTGAVQHGSGPRGIFPPKHTWETPWIPTSRWSALASEIWLNRCDEPITARNMIFHLPKMMRSVSRRS